MKIHRNHIAERMISVHEKALAGHTFISARRDLIEEFTKGAKHHESKLRYAGQNKYLSPEEVNSILMGEQEGTLLVTRGKIRLL